MTRLIAALLVVMSAPLPARAQTAAPAQIAPIQNQLTQVQQVPLSASTPAATPPAVVGRNPPAASELPAGFPSAQQPQALPTAAPMTTPRDGQFIPSEVISVLPPVAKAAELRAVLRTSVGDITIKLDRVNAPATVAHFVGLARGEKEFTDVKTSKPVKRPFYNGLIFHRAVKETLIQTGCPFGNGRGGPGAIATAPDEIKATMKFARPGMVAMAPMRDAVGLTTLKNSNGSQFFITLKEMPDWAGQFTVFGEVEDGMDVVQKIANSKVGPTERPIKRIYLVAVEIIEQ